MVSGVLHPNISTRRFSCEILSWEITKSSRFDLIDSPDDFEGLNNSIATHL